jgi:selenoprotein W-related protein
LAAKLLPKFKQRIKTFVMIPSKGGCFELTVGGRKVYSKLQTGRFPDEDAILKDVEAALGGR